MKTYYQFIVSCLLAVAALGMFGLSACEEVISEPTTEELLTSTWQLLSVEANGVSQNTADFRLSFLDAGSYAIQAPGMDVPNSGTWALNDSETEILLNGGIASITIVSISSTGMTLRYTQENYKSEQVTFEFVFEKAS